MTTTITNTYTDAEIKKEINRKRKYSVMALNNDTTTYTQVVEFLMKNCGYPFEQADHYTRTIDREGKAIVYWENKTKCDDLVKKFKLIKVVAKTIKN